MLIICNACNSKIRVPESAAGKRVKCPMCATVVRVPEAEMQPESAPPVPIEPLPQESPQPPEHEEPVTPDAITSAPPSSSAKPPPIKPKRAAADAFDDDEDEDDAPRPPGKRRGKYDDDDDDDEDDFDVRRRRRKPARRSANGTAVTSMVMGIISVVCGLPALIPNCCCNIFGFISIACGVVAVILAHTGKSPGSEGMCLAGTITGSAGIVLSILGFLLLCLSLTLGGGWAEFNRGFQQGFNQGMNQGNRRR
jgi:hypothetical protein